MKCLLWQRESGPFEQPLLSLSGLV